MKVVFLKQSLKKLHQNDLFNPITRDEGFKLSIFHLSCKESEQKPCNEEQEKSWRVENYTKYTLEWNRVKATLFRIQLYFYLQYHSLHSSQNHSRRFLCTLKLIFSNCKTHFQYEFLPHVEVSLIIFDKIN